MPRSGPLGRLVLALVAGMLAILAVVVAQVWPNPPAGLADPIWAEVGPAVGQNLPPRIAANASGPWHALGPALLFVCVLIRAVLTAEDRALRRRLPQVLAGAGLVNALFGIAAENLSPDSLLWLDKSAYLRSVTGTFVNRNTAATYFGSISVLWIVIAGRAASSAQAARTSRALLALAAAGICLGATAMTGSRAGFLLTALVCALTLALLARGRLGFGALNRRPSVWLAVASCALVLLQVGGDNVARRLQSDGLRDVTRSDLYDVAWRLIADRPWLGHGLGSFEAIFPAYRPNSMGSWGIYELAHSTPLEIAIELGLPVLIMIAALAAWIAVTLVRGSLRRDRARFAAIAALGVGALGALHSFIDFSLQVPGYASIFGAVVGCGLAAAMGGGSVSHRSRSTNTAAERESG